MSVTLEQFVEIFENDDYVSAEGGDHVLNGLIIIAKYIPNKTILQGANHEIVYSVDIESLIKAEITLEDANQLHILGWMIEDDYLAHFV